MNIIEFLENVIGDIQSASEYPIIYIIAAAILMILLDGIITFLFGGLTVLFKGKK